MATAGLDRAWFPRPPLQPRSRSIPHPENKLFGYRKRSVVITYSDADIMPAMVDILPAIQRQRSIDAS
jgi:hypothetical protein